MIKYIGSSKKYSHNIQRNGKWSNGWVIDIDLVPKNSWIIGLGVGADIGFELELIESKKCKILAIDPLLNTQGNAVSPEKENYLQKLKKEKKINDDNFFHIRKYITNTNNENNITLTEALKVCGISIEDVSVFKMDIEGSEYSVLDTITEITVPQIGIEFHHWHKNCNKNKSDTINYINKVKDLGYTFSK